MPDPLASLQPARLYFGVNTVAEVFAQNEIAELATVIPDFAVKTCLWRPESDPAWDGFIGTQSTRSPETSPKPANCPTSSSAPRNPWSTPSNS